MTQQEITIRNLGQTLDDLCNLDPRGYGVCKILYKACREYTGGPVTMNAAQQLVKTVKEGDRVFVMTGFVLRPFKHAETDGIISSVFLCRALVKAFGAKPVLVCAEENLDAAKALASCVGLHVFDKLEDFFEIPVSMNIEVFTKDAKAAPALADQLIAKYDPKAVVSIECPGCNERGVYHNATGLDVTELEAKQDSLFEKLQEKGVLNIAIGDLGNEIGMGSIKSTLDAFIPYAKESACRCGCGGGIAVKTKADHLITATVSDWGCYAMIAAIAYLMENADIMHDAELEKRAMICAVEHGMIDMYGWLTPAIDGFGTEICLPIVSLMKESVKSALSLKDTCKTWFEKVEELKYFEQNP